MSNFKKVALSAIGSVAVMGAMPSIAQGEGGSSGPMLEEILVTAQKRVQSMQDVPATISAIGERELRDAGLFDIRSVGQREPGIYFEGQAKSRPVVVVRGIGQSTASIHDETAVGTFVDGVYMPRISGAIQSIANVDRIEVLKGPQGTLYGRNTIGGAMSIYTRKPSQEFSGHVDAGFANYDSWNLGAYIEGALVEDRVAGSLGLSQSFRGGAREDIPTGAENDEESTYARGRLLFTPSDSLEVDFTMTYTREEADAVLEEPDGAFPIPFTAIPAPVPPFPPGTILFSVPPEVQMAALADSATDFYSDSVSEPGLVDVETFLANATVTWSSEQFEITSITGYYETEVRTVRDFDISRFAIIDTDDNADSDTFSQELRLSSVEGGAFTFNDRMDWLLGMYYFQDDATQKFGGIVGTDSVFGAFLNGGQVGNDLYTTTVDTTSYALFAQGTYALTDSLRLTLGLRYSKDEKDYVYDAVTDAPGVPLVVFPFTVADELEFDSLDPRIALDYQFSDEVMGYVSYSQGYKSGGPQFAVPVPAIAAQGYDEETVDAWEAGIKSRLVDQRLQLNAAVFSYDYQDMQRNSIEIVGGTPVSITANAAEADLQGLELDLQYLLTESLLLEAGYAYLDTEFGDYVILGRNLSGNQLPLAPENSYSLALQYSFELAGWDSSARVDYFWRDEIFFEEDNNLPGVLGDDVGQFNASIRLTSPGDHLELRIFCSNCTDEEYVAFKTVIGDTGYGGLTTGDRRRFGIGLRYMF